MLGRKAQPTILKMKKGNLGKRPPNKKEPQPKKVLPPCPKWLTGEARAEWKRITPVLYELGILTEIDLSALEKYCMAHKRWRQAETTIDKEKRLSTISGNGSPCALPEVAISQKYLKIMQSYLADFGMNPSARSRLSVSHGKDKDGFDF